MNKYIVPVYNDDNGENTIEVIMAVGLNEAKDKIIANFTEMYDLEFSDDWDDFVYHKAVDAGLYFGEVDDIEEL